MNDVRDQSLFTGKGGGGGGVDGGQLEDFGCTTMK